MKFSSCMISIAKRYYKRSGNKFQIWQDNNYPEFVETDWFFDQKLGYIHDNPVKKEYVKNPEDWLYSSARYYISGDQEPIRINPFE